MAEKRPDVSVITAVYNAAPWVKEAIQSVLAQKTDLTIEHILVDDGSTDNSLEILRSIKHPRVHVFSGSKNQGPGPARNIAAEHAQGEFLMALDADDLVAVDAIQKKWSALKARGEKGVLAMGGMMDFQNNGSVFHPGHIAGSVTLLGIRCVKAVLPFVAQVLHTAHCD